MAFALVNPVNKSLCLEQMCASNYHKLFQLIPELTTFKDCATGLAPRQTALHIKVLERTPYTLTVELSHCFDRDLSAFFAPAVKIRIYLDAQLAEVLSDHSRASVAQIFKDPAPSRDIMNYKWRLNYFLQKWLDHCLLKDYRFSVNSINDSLADTF